MELNEVGFKFVRKCINAVETKGEVLPSWHPELPPSRCCFRGPELYGIFCSLVVRVSETGLWLLTEEHVSQVEILRGLQCYTKFWLGLNFCPCAGFIPQFLTPSSEHTG